MVNGISTWVFSGIGLPTYNGIWYPSSDSIFHNCQLHMLAKHVDKGSTINRGARVDSRAQ